MESKEFKDIVRRVYEALSENNYINVLREAEALLSKYIRHLERGVTKGGEYKYMLDAERKELNELYNLIKTYISEYDLRLGKNSIAKKDETLHGNLYVGIVKRKIPKFRGADNKIYGPFKAGDIILISEKDFNKLRDRGLITEEELMK